MASKKKIDYKPKARFTISRTGGPMKNKRRYTRKRKHKKESNYDE